MKHIKIFENFLNENDLRRDIEGLLIELVDNGFGVDVDIFNNERTLETKILVTIIYDELVETNTIYFSEISEDVETTTDYIGHKANIINIDYGWWNEFEHEYQPVNSLKDCYASRFRIEYKVKL